MSNKDVSVVLAGVGGQGILLASDVMAHAAINAGYDVKTNEIHGMAQRGGAVTAQIHYGQNVNSPIIQKGNASVLGALEPIEALRNYEYLKSDGLAVVNLQNIIPVTVSMGRADYPDDIDERLENAFDNLIAIDAGEKASELGNIKTANIIVLGALSQGLDIAEKDWKASIKECVKPDFIDINLEAFQIGRDM